MPALLPPQSLLHSETQENRGTRGNVTQGGEAGTAKRAPNTTQTRGLSSRTGPGTTCRHKGQPGLRLEDRRSELPEEGRTDASGQLRKGARLPEGGAAAIGPVRAPHRPEAPGEPALHSRNMPG